MAECIELEKRVRAVENKVWIATGAAIVFAAWFGVANLYYIPKSVESAVDKTTSGETAKSLKKLLDQATNDSQQVARLSQDGTTIKIGGKCFKPIMLTRCFVPGNGGDHITWVNNRNECGTAGGNFEGEVSILGAC